MTRERFIEIAKEYGWRRGRSKTSLTRHFKKTSGLAEWVQMSPDGASWIRPNDTWVVRFANDGQGLRFALHLGDLLEDQAQELLK